MRTLAALILLAAIVNAGNAQGFDGGVGKPAAPAMKPVDAPSKSAEVKGARIHTAEILGATNCVDIDLGPSPPVGAARVIERAEIERAYETANTTMPKKLPASVRVTRKTRRFSPGEVANLVRSALADTPIARGGSLQNVRASGVEVPADFDHVTVELAQLPRRAGIVSVTANVAFVAEDGTSLFKTIMPIEIALPPEAAHADIARGQPITLIVRRGLVEVSIGGVAGADADVGQIMQVTLKATGRVLRARAIDKDHAVALEDS